MGGLQWNYTTNQLVSVQCFAGYFDIEYGHLLDGEKQMGVIINKVAAHRSFKPPKHDLGRVQSIQKCRRCAICAIECQKKHENVSRSSNAV